MNLEVTPHAQNSETYVIDLKPTIREVVNVITGGVGEVVDVYVELDENLLLLVSVKLPRTPPGTVM